jgi:hypothetical protein
MPPHRSSTVKKFTFRFNQTAPERTRLRSGALANGVDLDHAIADFFRLQSAFMDEMKKGAKIFLPRADGGEPEPYDPFQHSRGDILKNRPMGIVVQIPMDGAQTLSEMVQYMRERTGNPNKTRDDVLAAASASYLKLIDHWGRGLKPLREDPETGLREPWVVFSSEPPEPEPDPAAKPMAGSSPNGMMPG